MSFIQNCQGWSDANTNSIALVSGMLATPLSPFARADDVVASCALIAWPFTVTTVFCGHESPHTKPAPNKHSAAAAKARVNLCAHAVFFVAPLGVELDVFDDLFRNIAPCYLFYAQAGR